MLLEKLGLTADEIAKLSTLTEEEATVIYERINKNIADPIINDPNKFKEIESKAKFEAVKIAEKKVAKALGITIEDKDDLNSILSRGVAEVTKGMEKPLQEMQNENLQLKEKLTWFETEELPAQIGKVRNEVNQVYIDNDIQNLGISKAGTLTLQPKHAKLALINEINDNGLLIKRNEENKTIIVTKDGNLKPTINGKTYESDDIEGIAKAYLDPYIVKNNGGGGQGANPAGVQRTEQVDTSKMDDYTKRKLAELDSLGK